MKRSRINPINRKRRRAEFRRCYGSRERVRAVQSLRCICCGDVPSENAHVRGGGMGRKAGWEWIVPLCCHCHTQLHAMGSETWQNAYRVDLEHEAKRLAEALPADLDTLEE